jgi:hypothetical protein
MSEPKPQPIADWLEKLGLSQYAQRFTEDDINVGILPHLTDQDLKELGVVSLGHRRQLLLAIAELKGVQKDAAPATEEPIASHDAAERRQVTVCAGTTRSWQSQIVLLGTNRQADNRTMPT